ncbi:unnamed protein product [Amoebophrya sp. A120]|nr:unnamed protein product [Amoebophrya sp. A120]|eukprot:GSA120T00001329001.1
MRAAPEEHRDEEPEVHEKPKSSAQQQLPNKQESKDINYIKDSYVVVSEHERNSRQSGGATTNSDSNNTRRRTSVNSEASSSSSSYVLKQSRGSKRERDRRCASEPAGSAGASSGGFISCACLSDALALLTHPFRILEQAAASHGSSSTSSKGAAGDGPGGSSSSSSWARNCYDWSARGGFCGSLFFGRDQWHKAAKKSVERARWRRKSEGEARFSSAVDRMRPRHSSHPGGRRNKRRTQKHLAGTISTNEAQKEDLFGPRADRSIRPQPASLFAPSEFLAHLRQRSYFLLADGRDLSYHWEPETLNSASSSFLLENDRGMISPRQSGTARIIDAPGGGQSSSGHPVGRSRSSPSRRTEARGEEGFEDADFCAHQTADYARRIDNLLDHQRGTTVKGGSLSSTAPPHLQPPHLRDAATSTTGLLLSRLFHTVRSTASRNSISSSHGGVGVPNTARATLSSRHDDEELTEQEKLSKLAFDYEYYGPYAHVPLLSDREGQEAVLNFCTLLEGIQDGASLLIFYFLKNTFHLSPVMMSISFGITNLPWIIKPIMAYTTDTVFINDQRRKPYVVLANLLAAAAYLGIGVTHSFPVSLLCLATAGVGRAFGLAAIQGFIVENSERSAANGPVSEFFWMRAVGGLVASYFSGVLIGHGNDPGYLLSCLAVAPTLAAAVAARFMIEQQRSRTSQLSSPFLELPASLHKTRSLRENWDNLKYAMQKPVFLGPLIYLLCYSCGPNYDDALYYFYVNQLHFSPEFMGRVSLIHSGAKLMGLALYRYCLGQNLTSRQVLATATLVSIPFYVTPSLITSGAYQSLGWNPKLLALGGEIIRDSFLYVQLMPALAAAAKVGPAGMESTVFSVVTALGNAGRAVQRLSSAGTIYAFGVSAENYTHLTSLIFFCGGTLCLPLLILPYVQFVDEHEDERSPADDDSDLFTFNRNVEHEIVGKTTVIAMPRPGGPAERRDEMSRNTAASLGSVLVQAPALS